MTAAYQPLAAQATLERSAGSDLAHVLEACDQLSPVVEPLALTVLLRAFDAETGAPEPLAPDVSTWQLVERRLPEHVTVPAAADPAARRVEVAELERGEIGRFIETALDQPTPAPDAVVGLGSIHCEHVRAAISDQGPEDGGYRLLTADGLLELPVQLRRGRAYVLSAAEGVSVRPPVGWALDRLDGWLRLVVSVNWSPWLQLDRPEGAGVRAAVQRLRQAGWSLAEPSHALELRP